MNQIEAKRLFVLANRFKEGDLLVGGTKDEKTAREAREQLGSLRLGEIGNATLVEDGATDALKQSLDDQLAREVSTLSVANLKDILLGDKAEGWADAYRDGLSSEAIAAVVKVMTDEELSSVARSLFNPMPGPRVSIGAPGHFGSRIQPNSPGDDDEEILFSTLEGLTYGCGDVIVGLNPASDDVQTIVRLEDQLRAIVERLQLPTRYCVLSDIIKQTAARERTRVEVGFQSLAGTSTALLGMVGLDVSGIAELARGFEGLYFETGQGSEVTNGAAEGLDMVTLESRTYGVARAIGNACRDEAGAKKWMIVNDVAGFIGPEVFRSAEQLRRACLEDSVMGKVHGLTMGLDVCATFHMGLEPAALRDLTREIVEQAAPAYLMAVAGKADPMLGYMTTSFREHPPLRRALAKQITSAMQERLTQLAAGSTDNRAADLYAAFVKAGGEARSLAALRDEGLRKLADLQSRGWDLGSARSEQAALQADQRMQAIYEHARRALYAQFDESVLAEVSPRHVVVGTRARDRDEYLSHPSAGEQLGGADERRLRLLYGARAPQVQIVISDGLNANAANENLHELLPPLRRLMADLGVSVGDIDIVIKNGRVRAGYVVGAVLDVEVVVHLIGERPGTGLNMLSAYLTYGRDKTGRPRWTAALEHSSTTAISGIHRAGKQPATAAVEIANVVRRMLDEQRSGFDLTRRP